MLQQSGKRERLATDQVGFRFWFWKLNRRVIVSMSQRPDAWGFGLVPIIQKSELNRRETPEENFEIRHSQILLWSSCELVNRFLITLSEYGFSRDLTVGFGRHSARAQPASVMSGNVIGRDGWM